MHRVAASIRKVIEARVVEMNEKPDIATTHVRTMTIQDTARVSLRHTRWTASSGLFNLPKL